MAMSAGGITDPQMKFIKDLIAGRNLAQLNDAQREFLLAEPSQLDRLDKKQASNVIKALLECPKVEAVKIEVEQPRPLIAPDTSTAPQQEVSKPSVPMAEINCDVEPGYFFIVDPTDGKEKFFRVNKGKDRWEGYTFLAVQASDFFYPIKSPEHRKAVLAEIAKDPVNAMNQYGIRLGRCGVCNRTLTDRDSILLGIGPICAARLSAQPSESDLNLLAQLGLTKDE